MAIRYSGNATIRLTYRDQGDYKVTIAVGGRNVWRGAVGAPASGFGEGIAYDGPEAYDATARAALAFAENEGAEFTDEYNESLTERAIRRTV